jgi:hypothetical protein
MPVAIGKIDIDGCDLVYEQRIRNTETIIRNSEHACRLLQLKWSEAAARSCFCSRVVVMAPVVGSSSNIKLS